MSPDQAAAAPAKAQKPERITPRAHTHTRTNISEDDEDDEDDDDNDSRGVVEVDIVRVSSAPPSNTIPPCRRIAFANIRRMGTRFLLFNYV